MSERQSSKEEGRKEAVSLSVDAELLDEARRLGVNLSETLEARLRRLVKAGQEERWVERNRDALAAYNARVADHGLLSDEGSLL